MSGSRAVVEYIRGYDLATSTIENVTDYREIVNFLVIKANSGDVSEVHQFALSSVVRYSVYG